MQKELAASKLQRSIESPPEARDPPVVRADKPRGTAGTGENDIAVSQLTGAMGRVAKFCETNDPKHVAKIIRPDEIAALQSHARVIVAWLGQFTAQL